MPTARTITSRAIAADDLTPAAAARVREQAAQHDRGDPLPDVTDGLRVDEEATTTRLFRTPRTTRSEVELLLTPELLVVVDHAADHDEVALHPLRQVEFSAAPAELLAKVTGMPVDVPDDRLPVTSRPLGGERRSTRYVRVGTGPDVTAFRAALTAAVEAARPRSDR
ncbi:hypothetical protein ACR9E3_09945 [Actinomycetospora sp. C-140]